MSGARRMWRGCGPRLSYTTAICHPYRMTLERRIRRNAFRFKKPVLLKLADEVEAIRDVLTEDQATSRCSVLSFSPRCG